MKLTNLLLVCLGFAVISCSQPSDNQTASHSTDDVLSKVNTLIGTAYHGHTFPGAVVPFGMVQLSPDTRDIGWDACGGYHHSDSAILGFSHTHLSGTGIGDYGDVLMMPFTGNVTLEYGNQEDYDSGYKSRFRKETQVTEPGYYKVELDRYNVKAELTAATRTGMHKYTFPEAEQAGFIIDLTHTIQGNHNRKPQHEVEVIGDNEIVGLKKSNGWATNHYAYFAAKYSKPVKFEVYNRGELLPEAKSYKGDSLKVLVKFTTSASEEVFVKVGISSTGIEGAQLNRDTEIADWDFEKVKSEAQDKWRAILSKVKIKGGSEDQQTVFYTAMYHSALFPSVYNDVDGKYRSMDQQILQSEDNNHTVFSIWDTYRAQHPWFTIMYPSYNQELIRTLLRKYDEGGVLPKWELASNYTGTMIGYHSVSVIADSYMKGMRDFDLEKAFEAIIHASNFDSVKNIYYPPHKGHVKEKLMPRAKYYNEKYDYIPSDLEIESVAKALEFAYNDWCIALVAQDMGKEDIAKEYFRRSKRYTRYFDKEQQFMRGVTSTGEFKEPFNPYMSTHRKDEYCEGNGWQWTWYVPHDVQGLIDLFGGADAFAVKLDSLFNVSSDIAGEHRSNDISGLIGQYAHGNEPSQHIIYFYNYVNQPWKTQEYVDQVIDEFYRNTPDGLAGNEDCGQMSAWYLLSSIGFYQIAPGDPRYNIGKPQYEEVVLSLENGKTFTIKAENYGDENKYVQKVTLNNQPVSSQFIDHSSIAAGGELVFTMGTEKKVFWENQD